MRIKCLIREYYITKSEAVKKEFEEANTVLPVPLLPRVPRAADGGGHERRPLAGRLTDGSSLTWSCRWRRRVPPPTS